MNGKDVLNKLAKVYGYDRACIYCEHHLYRKCYVVSCRFMNDKENSYTSICSTQYDVLRITCDFNENHEDENLEDYSFDEFFKHMCIYSQCEGFTGLFISFGVIVWKPHETIEQFLIRLDLECQ